MDRISDWDWQVDEKTILDPSCLSNRINRLEESSCSFDGESVAAVAGLKDGGFTVNKNGKLWENIYERIWFLRYSPSDSLTALVYNDGEWGLSVEDSEWRFRSDYIWDTKFSLNNTSIAVAVQKEMKYGMALNGDLWPQLFDNANSFILSPDGRSTAAVVQLDPIRQAELPQFRKGCYSIAVNGIPWAQKFTNAWTPVFDPANPERVAVQVRMGLYDYTIAVDGKMWKKNFKSVWEPEISPVTGSVIAPVREDNRWGLACDGEILWKPAYHQLWKQQFSDEEDRIIAIAAVNFGKWTIVENNIPWKSRFKIITDLSHGNNGKTIAAAVCNDKKWSIIVNDKIWPEWWDRVWSPVVSPYGSHVAAKIKDSGCYTIAINGKPMKRRFTKICDPIFSPDGEKILVRGVENGKHLRIVTPLSTWS